MDIIDQKIIAELKINARVRWGTLAILAGISRQALTKRIERMENNGIIDCYTILTSHKDIDKTSILKAFLRIRFTKENDCFKLSKHFLSYTNVIDAWAVTGDWDAVILVKGKSMEAISEIREIIVKTGGIHEIETEVVMNNLLNG